MSKYLVKKATQTFLLSLIVFGLTACQRGGSRLPNGGLVDTPNPFTDGLGGNFADNGGGSIFDLDGGIGGDNGSGPNDVQTITIRNLLDELETVNPQDEDSIEDLLGADLANQLMQEVSPEEAFQKIALAGQVLQKCLTGIADYYPQPGEPLQGSYAGKCGGSNLNLSITGIYQKIFRRRRSPSSQNNHAHVTNSNMQDKGDSISDTQNPGFVNGLGLGKVKFAVTLGGISKSDDDDDDKKSSSSSSSKKGVMTVNSQGVGSFKVSSYNGVVADVNSSVPAFTAVVSRPESGSGKHVTPGCKGNLPMKASANPIPEKYAEAMKKVGQCYRKALILFSPEFDKTFRDMDPQLRQIFQQRILGISTN